MTSAAIARPPTNFPTGLRTAISAFVMVKLHTLRHYLSADGAIKELRMHDPHGLADIGIIPSERDGLSIHRASSETRDRVIQAAGWLHR